MILPFFDRWKTERRPEWNGIYLQSRMKPRHEIRREQGLELHPLLGPLAEQAEFPRMQQMSFRLLTPDSCLPLPPSPLHLIAHQRVADDRQMDSDLRSGS